MQSCTLNWPSREIEFNLPILDIKLNIDQDGNIHHKLYTKPASKGITLNFHSHHPNSVKRAGVANEFKRAQLCASAEHRAEAFQATRTKLTRNNYPSNWTNPHTRRRLKKKPHRPTTFTFNIPYIIDKFNANVKHILTKHNIPARLTNLRGRTVRELARRPANTPSRCQSKACPAPGICQRSSVIYKATCRICGLFYVGLTQRKLHDRAREHVTATRKRSRSSALGEHYRTQHPVPCDADDKDRQPSITFEVLSQHRDILHLHIEEAMAIQLLRPPLMQERTLGNGLSSLISLSKNFSHKKNKNRSLYTIPFYTFFHQQIHARTSFTHPHGKLPTKLGPVSFSIYRTLYTTNHFLLSFFS